MNKKKKPVKKEEMEREKPLKIEGLSFEEAMKLTMQKANEKMAEKRTKKD